MMTAEQAEALRQPFPETAIGKLPKPYSKTSEKGNCRDCGGYHGLPAAHLDYVGHAATTARLLQVDPCWTWEPFAVTPDGLPLILNGGLWIRLTICGVTRPGYGDGPNPKEMIGDAIRNAAMRFGVALDLWSKEDLHDIEHPPEPVEYAGPEQTRLIGNRIEALDDQRKADFKRWWRTAGYPSLASGTLTAEQADIILERLTAAEPAEVAS